MDKKTLKQIEKIMNSDYDVTKLKEIMLRALEEEEKHNTNVKH